MINRRVRSIAPNLLTLANLFSGFTAIIYITQNDFYSASIFIFLGAVFDLLDGMIARILKTASDFGVELDSLSDAITFGLAPSFMLYFSFFKEYGDMGILFSSLPTLAGVVRLARFNSQLSSLEDKKYFTGLPIPSGALTIISYVMFYDRDILLENNFREYFTFGVTILVSLVMVSRIKYDNFPRPSLNSFKENPILFTFVILSCIVIITTNGVGLFLVMMTFIISGILRNFIYLFKQYDEYNDEDLSEIDDLDNISEIESTEDII